MEQKALDSRTKSVIARLRHLVEKLESGEWKVVNDGISLRPGRPERYFVEYERTGSLR